MSRFSHIGIEILEQLDDEKISLKYDHKREANIKQPLHCKPIFDYHFLNIDIEPKYCVCKSDLPKDVYVEYFRKVKQISSKTLGYCLDNFKHFKITSQPNKEEQRLYKLLVLNNVNAPLDHNNMPLFGHFELWTSIDNESPRVFFVVGRMGLLNILLIDFKHEIHLRK